MCETTLQERYEMHSDKAETAGAKARSYRASGDASMADYYEAVANTEHTIAVELSYELDN